MISVIRWASSLTSDSTTSLGSITLAAAAHYLPAPAYKISKATLNALTVQYALDYEKEGFAFVAIAPGVSDSYAHAHAPPSSLG